MFAQPGLPFIFAAEVGCADAGSDVESKALQERQVFRYVLAVDIDGMRIC